MATSIAILDTQSDSQETNSTSLVEDTFNISFESICLRVDVGVFFAKKPKLILDGINGQFNAGELSVIIGQSGAGKSSLIDILAGYTKPTSGKILLNGKVRNEKMFRRRSCYIPQEDKMHDSLTVKESLQIAAELKLGNHVSRQQKHDRINEIMTSLGLDKNSHKQAGKLSGGQRKRLSIGLELVTDPPIMFLDEPTSGLDSSTAKQILYLLHLLAKQGRTVVTSLHQPSNQLLSLVDRLYAISSGRCTYNGSVRLLRPFLEQFDLVCPKTHDPVDFFIEISAPVSESQIISENKSKRLEDDSERLVLYENNSERLENNRQRLVQGTDNGKSIRWVENNSFDIDNKVIDNLFKNTNTDRICLTTLPAPKEDPTSKILLALKSTYPTPFWKQFAVLTRREYLLLWRDMSRTLMITGIHVMMALFVGTLFYNIGVDAKDAINNISLLFFCLMFPMFTAFSRVSVTFPEQVSIIRREHFNRWYTAGSCYSATLLSSLPTQTVCSLVFAIITYYLAGHPLEWQRFLLYCCTVLLVSYVAMFVGLLNGSIFSVKNGTIFGPFFIMPFVIFGGFFLQLPDAPSFLKWLFHVSFLKYGFSGMVISIFGNRPKLPCTSDEFFCYYTYPQQLLKDRGMENDTFLEVVLALGIIASVFIMCAYIVLKIRLKSKW